MAETPSKRQREETHVAEDDEDSSKRHKSYSHHILSLLEEDEDETNIQDFSSILTTLQRELSSDSTTIFDDPLFLHRSEAEPDPENPTPGLSSELSSHGGLKKGGGGEEEDERERVMRHLLEASDDELGIPHRVDGGGGRDDDDDGVINGGDAFALCDGLWELEDEAANYYTLMQSELFM